MWERIVTPFVRKNYLAFSRISLFIVYFYFGAIKVFSTSPAAPLVYALHEQTISFIPFKPFYVGFSLFEMLIGVLFLIPKFTKVVFILFILHMGTTMLPLVLLPTYSWESAFVPTLEGQYMIKNLVLIALACSILVNSKRTK